MWEFHKVLLCGGVLLPQTLTFFHPFGDLASCTLFCLFSAYVMMFPSSHIDSRLFLQDLQYQFTYYLPPFRSPPRPPLLSCVRFSVSTVYLCRCTLVGVIFLAWRYDVPPLSCLSPLRLSLQPLLHLRSPLPAFSLCLPSAH